MRFKANILLVLSAIVLSACAPKSSNDDNSADSFARFWDEQLQSPSGQPGHPSAPPRFITERTLQCMWQAGDPGAQAELARFRSNIAPLLVRGFNETIRHNRIGSNEAVHFFSQLYHETAGFKLLYELAPNRYFGDGSASWRERLAQIESHPDICSAYPYVFESPGAVDFFNRPHSELRGQCVARSGGGADYRVRDVMVSQHTYGHRWRGRGLIQLTHCANYVKYVYYLATDRDLMTERDSRGRPILHSFSYEENRQTRRFSFTTGDNSNPLSISNCSDSWVEGLTEYMRNTRGVRNFDTQGILRNPDLIGSYCQPYFADVAGWYWKYHVQRLFPFRNNGSQANPCRCSAGDESDTYYQAIPSRPASLTTSGRCEERQATQMGQAQHGCFQSESSIQGQDRRELLQVAHVTRAINGSYCHSLRGRYELFKRFKACF